MKSLAELISAVKAGLRPAVTFAKGVEEKESYAEAGMRARITGASLAAGDDVGTIVFDYEEFAEHNKTLESANYYDKNGVARLTAREAGQYKPVESMYFDVGEDLSEVFQIESGEVEGLFKEYCHEKPGCSYVAWLEKKVLQARRGDACEGMVGGTGMTESEVNLVRMLPRQGQRQDGTNTQLGLVRMLANRAGCYDAADVIGNLLSRAR